MPQAILLQDVESLGERGTVIDVSPGYLRNYLLPRKLAVLANESNVRQLQHDREVISAQQAKLRGAAQTQAQKLQAVVVRISRKVGDQDKLFGSVTSLDIAEALAAQGQKVDRRAIHLAEPIKTTGKHAVEIRLHREVLSTIQVEVSPEA